MNESVLKTPIAIVGMACRLPGGSCIEDFWGFLQAGGNAVGELPADRLDRSLYFDPVRGKRAKTYTTLGGLVSEPQHGNGPSPFTAQELQDFDPCHRNLCEVAVQACLDAGFATDDLSGKQIGVFVGHSGGSPVGTELTVGTLAEEALDFVRDVPEFSSLPSQVQSAVLRQACESFRETRPKRKRGGHPELTADRAAVLISRILKLDGPAMSIDAACASSLVALILGVLAIQRGQVEAAIIGGASWAKSDSLLLFSQAQSSSALASRPFDAAADGLIGSEGYVVLVVKSLAKAMQDGDRIHAVIRGLGISSDGCGRSLWAPRKEGQCAAMERAYGTEIDPASIEYIEAHATSTQVGDATEMEALELFFAKHLQDVRVPVGSVKSNIGHTLETAGLASLLKVVLALQHGLIPPTVNLKTLNPTIPWERLPFYVPTEAVRWPSRADGAPRRAGINAFGIGGLNVHVILEETLPSSATAIGRDCFKPQYSEERPRAASVRTSTSKSSTSSRADDSVAVIGRGVILPGARSVDSLRQLLQSGRSHLVDAPSDRWRKQIGVIPGPAQPHQTSSCRGGYLVDYVHDWKQHRIPPKQIQRANPLQFMLLDATTQAFAEAGYDCRPFDKSRTAVVIGSAFGSEFSNQLAIGMRLPELRRALSDSLREHGLPIAACDELMEKYEEYLLKMKPALLDETGSFTTSTLASRIAKTFDLMGGALAIDAADCSSLAALDVARNLLLSGACSQVICGTGHRCLDLMAFEALALQGRLPESLEFTPDAAGRCFPGEGVAVVWLKRLGDARRDGDRERAIIRSIGAASHPGEARLAIESAIRRSGAESSLAMHWEFDGPSNGFSKSGTPLESSSGQTGCPTLASQTGYLQSAHGLVALIAASLADPIETQTDARELATSTGQRHGIVTRNQNGLAYCAVVEPVADVSVATDRNVGGSSTTQTTDSWTTGRAIGVPPSTSLACSPPSEAERHNGTDCNSMARMSVIDAGKPSLPLQAVQTLQIGARSTDELALRLEAAQANPDSWLHQRSHFSSGDQYRLAIVVPETAALPDLLKLATTRWRDPKSRAALEDKGIFSCQLQGPAPRIAVLFPGQGSQSPGMLRSLIATSKAARRQLEQADRYLAELQESSFEHLAWESGDRLDVDLWTTQLSMLVADVIAFAALEEIGVRPDCMAGHSFGEYPAMIASGVCTLAQAIVLTRARTRAILESNTEGTTLLAINASPRDVQAMLNGDADQLFLTHFNAPERTVVGGSRPLIQEFSRRLRSHRIVSQELPVPRAFHTPLMHQAQSPLRDALNAEQLRPPHTLLLSSVTNRYVADPHEIRDNLVAQLVEPVRYEQLVRRLVDDGATILIEAGPRQVLTQLNRQILAGSSAVCLAIDHPKRSPAEQLACIQAALECAGVQTVAQEPDRQNGNATSFPHIDTAPVEQFDATRAREEMRDLHRGTDAPTRRTVVAGPVEQFDATSRRRERNRRSSGSIVLPPTVATALAAERRGDEKLVSLIERPTTTIAKLGDETSNDRFSLPSNFESLEGRVPQLGSQGSLEQFLIDFIVDQTGYPPEVVDLDADLEAELGIDSIRKAQLIGELRELNASSGPLLRNVRTLRQILELVEQSGDEPSAIPSLDKTKSESRPSHVIVPASPQRNSHPSASMTAPLESTFESETGSSSNRHGTGISKSLVDIEKFLIDFVVDQTGYPAEVVELDADLEAELGIDSIRKAQLIGELREHLSVSLADSEIPTLSKSRTLRQILDLMTARIPDRLSANLTSLAAAPIQRSFDVAPLATLSVSPNGSMARSSDRITNSTSVLRRPASPNDRAAGSEFSFEAAEEADGSAVEDSSNPFAVKDLAIYEQAVKSGREQAEKINARLRRFADQMSGVEILANSSSQPEYERQFSSDIRDQLRGIADGAGVHPASIVAFAIQHSLSSLVNDTADAVNLAAITNGDTCKTEIRSQIHTDRDLESDTVREELRTSTDPCNSQDLIGSPVTWRHVLRMVPAPQWPEVFVAPVFRGAALILGDNDISHALQDRLRGAGIHCHVLKPGDDPKKTVAELDRIWQQETVPHLFLVTPRDQDAVTDFDRHRWQRRWTQGIMTPFWLCQRWLQLVQRDNLMDDASIVGVTSLGGTFGFGSEVVAAESGALSGLLKAILIESWVNGFHTLPVKLIDTPPDAAPSATVDAVWRELAVPSYDAEVAWRDGQRSVVRAVRTPLPSTGGKPIPRGGNWICTGGARGITAYVARELALQYGLKLNLLGTAPSPQILEQWRDLSAADLKSLRNTVMQAARAKRLNPMKEWQAVEKAIEIDRNLRELRELGISVRYHQCDVSDREALETLLDSIRTQDGPIEGILHGAGFGKDARFDQKDQENVEKCLRAKVDGAFRLMELTRDDPLKYFVAFGSISGRFGANGHSDYSAANDMLARQTAWFRRQRPDVVAVAFHWHAWGDVGMATKPETRLALEMVNMQFMPAAEGLRHLIAELEAGAPEAEILVTDERYYRSFYPAETLMTEVGAGASLGASLPLLDSSEIVRRKGRTAAEVILNPVADPFLIEHRLDDRPLLPIVVGLELMCEIASAAGMGPVGQLRNLEALHGLKFHTDEPRSLRVAASNDGNGGMRCSVMADVRLKNGTIVEQDRTYLQAIALAPAKPLGKAELDVPVNGWERVEYLPRGAARMYHGPPLRCLRKVRFDNDVVWGRVAAPALVELAGSQRDVTGWMVPSAALDACLYATALLTWRHVDQAPSLPHHLDTLELGRRPHPGEPCIVEVRFLRRENSFAWFDFVLVGLNGDVIARATDYCVVLMNDTN